MAIHLAVELFTTAIRHRTDSCAQWLLDGHQGEWRLISRLAATAAMRT